MGNKILVPIEGSSYERKAMAAGSFSTLSDDPMLYLHSGVSKPEIPESLRRFVEIEYSSEAPETVYRYLTENKFVPRGEKRSALGAWREYARLRLKRIRQGRPLSLGSLAQIPLLRVPASRLILSRDREAPEDFGVDKRHEQWKGKKWTASSKKFRWRMVELWPSEHLLHQWSRHFCDSVRAASGGRLDIKLFPAGSMVPGLQVFDAVSQGEAECGHSVAGFWRGKEEDLVAFWSIPHGFDAEMTDIWLHERGGLEILQKIYDKFNLKVFPLGNAGQEMGFLSNKRPVTMEDFKGMKVVARGYYANIMNRLGASASVLPPPEIYLDLQEGIVKAAESSKPAVDISMSPHDAVRYVLFPEFRPSVQTELIINKKAWECLPDDLRAMVEICARETEAWASTWNAGLNARAMQFYKDKMEVVRMNDETLVKFTKEIHKYLGELKAKHPLLRKALESQEQLKREFQNWRENRNRLVHQPSETHIEGRA